MSAEQLEAACRKCVRVEVTDVKALIRVLEERKLSYKVLSQTEADIYEKVNVSQLVRALDIENCEVLSMQEKDESLESYYVSLVGGASHE